jgi:hypothetical protein
MQTIQYIGDIVLYWTSYAVSGLQGLRGADKLSPDRLIRTQDLSGVPEALSSRFTSNI